MTEINEEEKSKLLKAFEKILDSFGGSKQEASIPLLKARDEELREEISVVYCPNMVDGHGHWMSPETVAGMCEKLRKGFLEDNTLTLNLFHKVPLEKSKAEVKDIWLLDEDYKVGDMVAPKGSCVALVKYHDLKTWELRKSGEIGGFSVHGSRDKFKSEATA